MDNEETILMAQYRDTFYTESVAIKTPIFIAPWLYIIIEKGGKLENGYCG